MNLTLARHHYLFFAIIVCSSEVAALGLLQLDGLEKRLEVSSTEAIVVAPLNDLDEEGRPVLERLGENLQQIALLIMVDQDVQLLDVV